VYFEHPYFLTVAVVMYLSNWIMWCPLFFPIWNGTEQERRESNLFLVAAVQQLSRGLSLFDRMERASLANPSKKIQ
jgi:hypothetical protein